MFTLQHLAKAFQLWEEGFRAQPEQFLTYEECATGNIDELSAGRAEYFLELLTQIKE